MKGIIDAFHELNPRKGTETKEWEMRSTYWTELSTNLIPARGLKLDLGDGVVYSLEAFHELNPRKGTETLTLALSSSSLQTFHELNPRKGTETRD